MEGKILPQLQIFREIFPSDILVYITEILTKGKIWSPAYAISFEKAFSMSNIDLINYKMKMGHEMERINSWSCILKKNTVKNELVVLFERIVRPLPPFNFGEAEKSMNILSQETVIFLYGKFPKIYETSDRARQIVLRPHDKILPFLIENASTQMIHHLISAGIIHCRLDVVQQLYESERCIELMIDYEEQMITCIRSDRRYILSFLIEKLGMRLKSDICLAIDLQANLCLSYLIHDCKVKYEEDPNYQPIFPYFNKGYYDDVVGMYRRKRIN